MTRSTSLQASWTVPVVDLLQAWVRASRQRWKALPDTPTVQETLPGYEVNSFIGLGVTGGTPPAIVERLTRVTLVPGIS